MTSDVVRAEDVPRLMSSALVHQVLSMGIDASRVKMALQRRIGSPMYASANELVDAAFREQREQEYRATVENNPTPSAFESGGVRSASSEESGAPMDVVERPVRREERSGSTEESRDAEDEDEVSSQESQEETHTLSPEDVSLGHTYFPPSPYECYNLFSDASAASSRSSITPQYERSNRQSAARPPSDRWRSWRGCHGRRVSRGGPVQVQKFTRGRA